MKSILISIKPKWVAKILNGEKTIEVRKTYPKCELPITVYIYCTKTIKGVSSYDWGDFTFDDLPKLGKVVAKFTLREIDGVPCLDHFNPNDAEKTCISWVNLGKYVGNKHFYAWHISDLVIFRKPRELWEFSYGKPRCLLKSKGGVVINGFNFLDDELHVIKRPPQSWCYVEELK